MQSRRPIFGIVGALSAFPRRLAARAVAERGGQLRRGITRQTTHVVIGRKLLTRLSAPEIARRVAELRDRDVRMSSENGFLRWLHMLEPAETAQLARQSLLEQSRLAAADLDLLTLFDAFERDSEPFSFRDLILARKYAGLIAGGADWAAVARSVHRSGPVASLTALALKPHGASRIVATDGTTQAELDGQGLLPLDPPDDDGEEYFALAEAAEAEGMWAEASVLYGRCLALDPGDSIAAFNRANCYRELAELDDAAANFALAIKLDPLFVEAWFNYADLLRDEGRIDAARRHLQRAIEIDPLYADAVYNLASLEFDAGDHPAALTRWKRYLELDDQSEWAVRARHGIKLIEFEQRRSAG